jgi:alpha-beta hydrolase superfamily lysophospholipase
MNATQTSITMRDGAPLAVHRWMPICTARGTVLIAHGLGEHAGRYAQLASDLAADGWTVIAPDHRGHGLTPGPRGVLPATTAIRDDLLELLASARAASTGPLHLLGHSMGGAFAAWAVAESPDAVDGLILSSPALQADLSPVQRAMVAVMLRLAPDVAVSNGLKAQFISHDPVVVAAYTSDPLVHDRVSARLADAIVTAGVSAQAAAPQWRTPTVLLYAGDDRLVNPAGSRAFAAAAPAHVVTSRCFESLYHEIFNELERKAPVQAVLAWLRAAR